MAATFLSNPRSPTIRNVLSQSSTFKNVFVSLESLVSHLSTTTDNISLKDLESLVASGGLATRHFSPRDRLSPAQDTQWRTALEKAHARAGRLAYLTPPVPFAVTADSISSPDGLLGIAPEHVHRLRDVFVYTTGSREGTFVARRVKTDTYLYLYRVCEISAVNALSTPQRSLYLFETKAHIWASSSHRPQ